MFSSRFIWLFVIVVVYSAFLGVCFSFYNRFFSFKDKLMPKTNWRNRLKYAIPVWIIALIFICIMILRFLNPEDYLLKHDIERLHISILFCIYFASILTGVGFYILNYRRTCLKRKGKILRIICDISSLITSFVIFLEIVNITTTPFLFATWAVFYLIVNLMFTINVDQKDLK